MEGTVDLEGMVFRIQPGDGLVARFHGVAALMLPDGERSDAMATELLQAIRASLDQGPFPGRRLARQVAGLITQADPDDVPAFCLLAQAEKGIAVIVHGPVDLTVRGPAKDELLSGSRVVTWVDRILDAPFESIQAGRSGGSSALADERCDLRSGVVPGAGFSAVVVGASAIPSARVLEAEDARGAPADRAEVLDEPAPTPDETALRARAPVGAVEPERERPSFQSVDLGEVEAVEPREPLPVVGDEQAAAVAEAVADDELRELVEGVVCARGHFNDPSAAYCAACGISMVHRTLNLVPGPRPPLGVIVFDDGATYNLDGGYAVGREPGRDEAVTANRLRPLVLTDEDRTVSRVHAHVVLEGWDVKIVDRGSANGTYVVRPGESTWTPLTPHQATTIKPGTRVRIGDREFLFDSHHASR